MTDANSNVPAPTRFVLVCMLAAVAALVGLLLAPELERSMTVSAVDLARDNWLGDAARWFHRVRPRTMLLFGGIVGVVLVVLVVLVVAMPSRWRYLLLLLTAAVVANRACWLLKVAVSRDRPWASGLLSLHGIIDPALAGIASSSSHARDCPINCVSGRGSERSERRLPSTALAC